MKFIKHILPVLLLAVVSPACKDFLEKEPLGQETDKTFYKDPENAALAVNAIYDAIAWDEGGVTGSGHTYEWMYGDVLSDDAKKGSTTGDYLEIKQMETWSTLSNAPIQSSTWNNMYAAIYRANQVLTYLPTAPIDETLKSRFLGEAYFLRAYSYFNLVTKFGGVPIMDKPLERDQWGTVARATIAQTYAFVEQDLIEASNRLPEKYQGNDVGRATKGAAQAYLARASMYQIGTDNTNGKTWQNVYDATNAVINSGQYSLEPNYARLFEIEGENGPESIFELQFVSNNDGWGPVKTGTAASVIQNNRATWGWGFNNPTQDLVNEFELNDPRLPVSVYKDGDIVVGELQKIDYPTQNETGYLNRKAFVEKGARASQSTNSPKNIIKFRYADILLMQAEAAYHLGREQEARDWVNKVRARARVSTKPKGSTQENASDYQPYATTIGVLPDLTAIVSGQALLEAIWHERRVELAMEALRYYDLVRTGRYYAALTKKDSSGASTTNAQRHSITTGVVNPVPVLPIPLNESQAWKLEQNPGYQ